MYLGITQHNIAACVCDMNGSNKQCFVEEGGNCSCVEGYEGPKCNTCSEGYERQDHSGKCFPILPCPDGWTQMQGKCYKIGDGKATFEQAKSKCSDLGGYMVEPLDAGEDRAIKKLNNDHGQTYYWIGMNDQNEESK